MEAVDVAIVGAGLTGLATARAAARAGLSVCVLERHPRPGLDTSTRNSGVIHAGLYNPPGSLKSSLCIRGNPLLYDYCRTHGVPHDACGKVVVAMDDAEMGALEQLLAKGLANGVEGLTWLDADAVHSREPHVNAVAAVLSPTSGIVDAEALVMAGEVRLGPTVRYQSGKDDYDTDRVPVEAFFAAAQRLLRGLEPGDLRLGGSGIRPKLHGPDASFADFLIRRDTRTPQLVHAAGIESPGLTACLAIGDYVTSMLSGG